jgi:F0F1-type ATP synthase delta subunit
MAHKDEFVLPSSIISPIDLSQLIRELEEADQSLLQAGLRKGGEETKIPRQSRLLTEVVEANKLNLLHEDDRKQLQSNLTELKDKAPTLHMSFNADPSPVFMQKLTTWVRQELHPFALIQIGLLPTIGAGCVLRTSNKVFDFSLKSQFEKSRQVLIDKIRATAGAAQ